MRIPETLRQRLREAVEILEEHGRAPVQVVSHNDADGITAAAVLHSALQRAGYPCITRCVKQLDSGVLEGLAGGEGVVIFTDLGSGQLHLINRALHRRVSVVLDHHQPVEEELAKGCHVNAHLHGIDGARELSGAGMAYLFAKEICDCRELSALAIVGAVGDLQDSQGVFLGINREIIGEGEKAGVLRVEKDLRLFGRQTRPLYKALEYTTEPFLPGLSGNERSCIEFLKELDIPVKRDDRYVMLADLTQEERQRLTTALILRMIEHRIPPHVAESIVGEVVTLTAEEKRTPLRDAKEFATLMNACGKYEHTGIALAVCLGDRDEIYRRSLGMLRNHREYLSRCFTWVTDNLERVRDAGVAYALHAGEDISDSVIGTVAGMLLSSRALPELKPVLAFAYTKDGGVKVSARATKELVESGVNLGRAILAAAESVEGGGHDIAAGAKIQRGTEEEFLERFTSELRRQWDAHEQS
ncbi:MAG: DHH family phosphoesterase [Euryarchaeota archaeon]|nr:DHH family phosphoesterase [Euryarchaeota archaeon]